MKNYFDEPKNKKLLMQKINSWIGVPYEHMGETKSGIDCSKLLGKILFSMGVLKGNISGLYKAPDWMEHSKEEFLLNTIDNTLLQFLDNDNFYLKKSKDGDLNFGDFLFFSFVKSGVTHHSAIYMGENKIFHVRERGDCRITPLSFARKKRITWNYRLMLVG